MNYQRAMCHSQLPQNYFVDSAPISWEKVFMACCTVLEGRFRHNASEGSSTAFHPLSVHLLSLSNISCHLSCITPAYLLRLDRTCFRFSITSFLSFIPSVPFLRHSGGRHLQEPRINLWSKTTRSAGHVWTRLPGTKRKVKNKVQ